MFLSLIESKYQEIGLNKNKIKEEREVPEKRRQQR
jgi:hypothetical protein